MSANNKTDLQCTWTNGLIWMGVTLVVVLLARLLPWYFIFYKDFDFYPNAFCYGSIAAFLAAGLFPILFYALTYNGYMRRAAVHPQDLHGVAHGEYGRPWILQLILLLVLEGLWIFITMFVLKIFVQLDFRLLEERIILINYMKMSGVFYVLDIALFLIGTFLFQPNLVRNNR